MCVLCPLPHPHPAASPAPVAFLDSRNFPLQTRLGWNFNYAQEWRPPRIPRSTPPAPTPSHIHPHPFPCCATIMTATPTKYARQLLCHSIRLRRTPHPPTSPRGASLPLWLYKLSPCAGCASHANQISVGLIKNRSRDLQASQHCAQLSSDESSQSHNKLQPHSTFVCSEFNFVLSCCRHVWLLHVVWRCGAATAAARMCVCVCVCWGGCARVGSKPLWHNC